jgi:hypothetical protein
VEGARERVCTPKRWDGAAELAPERDSCGSWLDDLAVGLFVGRELAAEPPNVCTVRIAGENPC